MNGYAGSKRKYSRQMYGYLEIINTEVLSMWGKLTYCQEKSLQAVYG